MPFRSQTWTVALDGGTTNTRARLLRGDQVVATARRTVGVRDAVVSGNSRSLSLAEAVRACLDEVCCGSGSGSNTIKPDQIVAAGMLSSEVGLATVPHVVAPASLDDLARAAVFVELSDIADQPVLIVPGVRTPPGLGVDGWADADVMRGEECETLGAWVKMTRDTPGWASQAPVQALVWPGSHTKLVAVNATGQILASYTTLAGEMLAALSRHTLLAASLPSEWPDLPAAEPLAAGASAAERYGLGRSAFLVRIAALTLAWEATDRAAFLMGAILADDVAHLARHPLLNPAVPIWVGGRQPQRSLYADWLRAQHPGPVRTLDDSIAESASALGALTVAMRRVELGLNEP
ncbi:MAG TPA: 2-dehydro-3-deoxygalactonokinase [Isosphaeraceae bacterium]|jgi:2-dehydro-3-deoxygalactonokinase|nr:2-dehydro-3-deoxygalactonokinase [Isosphaeraceae bacterium]